MLAYLGTPFPLAIGQIIDVPSDAFEVLRDYGTAFAIEPTIDSLGEKEGRSCSPSQFDCFGKASHARRLNDSLNNHGARSQ